MARGTAANGVPSFSGDLGRLVRGEAETGTEAMDLMGYKAKRGYSKNRRQLEQRPKEKK